MRRWAWSGLVLALGACAGSKAPDSAGSATSADEGEDGADDGEDGAGDGDGASDGDGADGEDDGEDDGGDDGGDDGEVLPPGPCGDASYGVFTDPTTLILVTSTGSTGAAGSISDPVPTVAEALAIARSDASRREILVGPGSFSARIALSDGATGGASDAGLHISGCGRSETTLVAADSAQSVVQAVDVSGLRLEAFTLEGGTRGLWLANVTGTVEDIVVEGSLRSGIVFQGSDTGLVGRELKVRDPVVQSWTATDGSTHATGYGITINGVGATGVTLEGVEVTGATGVGILVGGGSTVELDTVAVADMVADSEGLGRGVQLQGGATGSLRELTVSAAIDTALMLVDAYRVEVEDCTLSVTAAADLGSLSTTEFSSTGDALVSARSPASVGPAADFETVVRSCALDSPARAGLVAEGVTLTVTGNTVTAPGHSEGGSALFVQGSAVVNASSTDTTAVPESALPFSPLERQLVE